MEELGHVRLMAEEDVVQFGEELARFGELLESTELDAETRHDYQTALDAYETAERLVDRLSSFESISAVVDTLTSGRYALACVRARVAGDPLPERRTPCFFNPQHGPATGNVVWTPRNGPTRTVPACAQDAARIKAGEDPPVRMVRYGEQQVPAWEAGAPNEPYRIGFFSASGARAHVMELKMRLKGEGRGQWGTDLGKPRIRRPYD
ncbi:hypothetical protein EV650_1912 [Kribbella kalugense]|uniref:Uncharacterized protein n=2 Tax=Kribbella kalugense TaxID=2512221 RepID=A0A4R7ZYE2_9ACTN|nr:hypothetical protein EV650_1912 [Kribbella kalugense]